MIVIAKYKSYLKKATFVWCGFAAVFVLAYILVLGPQRRLQRHMARDLAKKKQQYESAMKASQDEAQQQLRDKIADVRQTFGDYVIEFENSANLTFDISKIASEHRISSFSIKGKNNAGVSELPDCDYLCESRIQISCTADFHEFVSFVNALERCRPVLFVERFNIARSKQNESGPQVSLDLVALVRKPAEGQIARDF